MISVTRASSTLTFKTFKAPCAFSIAINPLPIGSMAWANLAFNSWLEHTPHELGHGTLKKLRQWCNKLVKLANWQYGCSGHERVLFLAVVFGLKVVDSILIIMLLVKKIFLDIITKN